uniref:Uncharacterized protein n=1 Tax=Parascaris equorum TaxID=6256 RepID=A0A914S000_PAREQ
MAPASIGEKLGTPSLTDWPANAVIERSNYPSYPGLSFERLAPKLPPDAAKLIKNPLYRFDERKRLGFSLFY